jgi:TolB-like protein/tetratricopeptide (TPR) repeat protein/DNA-binding winged helix-turn-helix (wHTH) protein
LVEVMDAADLQGQFRLGECLVEPRESRITGPAGRFVLEPALFALLDCLASHHGEAVSRIHLRRCAWPNGGGSDAALRAGIRTLREALGGTVRDRRYIVDAGPGGFALVAHFEALTASGVPAAAGSQSVAQRAPPAGATARLQHLLVELRRRSVFKVVGGYLVGMWLVLQVAETTFAPLRLPDWWLTALTILAVVGLPIVTALAWSYEITPGGIVLDSDLTGNVRLPRARRAIAPAIVAGVALMAMVTGIAWWQSISIEADTPPPAVPDTGYPSIAVLPLVDMSPAGGITYLGDGLSEELSARLAQVPGLRVAARTSAFEFKGRNLDVRRIGEALGVRHVLEGSVRRDGDNLRVTMQLIDAANGYHVWAGSYDRGWRDVIEIQDDIARSVTEALRVVLAPQAPSDRAEAPAPDVRAIDPYLAGLALLRQSGDMSKMREAEQRFAEAITIAPSFARAHAGRCTLEVRLYRKTQDPAHVIRAEEACRRALELDPTLLETEKGLAALYLSSSRLGESEAIYRRLVERYPADADGHMGLGQVLEASGRPEEAESSLRAAIQAEPAFWGAYAALGAFLFKRGRVEEATDAFREVTQLAPSANAFSNLGAALQLKGDLDGAAEAFIRSLAVEPSSSAYSNLGTVYYFRGRYEDAVAEYARATALTAQDQALWGNLADAMWQISGRRAEASGHYRRAIALAERQLESSPQDSLLVAQLGYYYGRVAEPERSRRYLERAAAARDDPHVAYYRAVAAADRGDLPAARNAVDEAARLGFPEALLQADPSLAAVRTDNTRGT